MNRKGLIIAAVLVLLLGCAGVGAWAAGNYGTQADPLVAMSYLEEVLQPKLEREFDSALEDAVEGVGAQAGAFESISLSASSVSLSGGTELVCLTSGAVCTGTLIDATAGGVLNAGGSLAANHLYIVSDASAVLSGEGEVLIRGAYSTSEA